MNLRDLEYIVAVAEEGHFGRASEKCNVSQPALSGQIKKLEEELGVKVFERTNRRVSLTDVGAEIVAKSKRVLAMADEIRDTAAADADPFAGSIRLGTIPTIGPYLLPAIMQPLRDGLPKLDISLNEDVTQSLERRLVLGDIDVAITATDPAVPGVDEVPLYFESFQVAVPGTHALAKSKTVDVSNLENAELLLLRDGHCLSDQVARLCGLARGRDGTVDTQASSLETIVGLVAAGAGVTLLPATAAGRTTGMKPPVAILDAQNAEARRLVRLIFRETYPKRKLLDAIAAVIADNLPPGAHLAE